jgi:hypothetical protein
MRNVDHTDLDVFDSFLARQPVARDDRGRVDLLLDQLVGVLELGADFMNQLQTS